MTTHDPFDTDYMAKVDKAKEATAFQRGELSGLRQARELVGHAQRLSAAIALDDLLVALDRLIEAAEKKA